MWGLIESFSNRGKITFYNVVCALTHIGWNPEETKKESKLFIHIYIYKSNVLNFKSSHKLDFLLDFWQKKSQFSTLGCKVSSYSALLSFKRRPNLFFFTCAYTSKYFHHDIRAKLITRDTSFASPATSNFLYMKHFSVFKVKRSLQPDGV